MFIFVSDDLIRDYLNLDNKIALETFINYSIENAIKNKNINLIKDVNVLPKEKNNIEKYHIIIDKKKTCHVNFVYSNKFEKLICYFLDNWKILNSSRIDLLSTFGFSKSNILNISGVYGSLVFYFHDDRYYLNTNQFTDYLECHIKSIKFDIIDEYIEINNITL